MQAAVQRAADELQLDLGKNVVLRDEAAAHAQDAKKHMQKLSERTAQVSLNRMLSFAQLSKGCLHIHRDFICRSSRRFKQIAKQSARRCPRR